MNDIIAGLLGDWSKGLNIYAVIFKVLLTFVLATIIGLERATKRHAAGLRTFILVALVSTLASMCDEYILSNEKVTFSFVTAATVVGIAIISANTINFSSRNQLKGLTTSVALWCMAVIAIFIGFDQYTIALVSFAVYVICVALFPKVEKYFKLRSNYFEISIELKGKNYIAEFTETIRRLGLKIDDIEINPAYANSGLGVYSIGLTIVSNDLKKCKTHEEIVSVLKELEYVNHVEIIN